MIAVKELDAVMNALLKRGAIQAEFYPDGALRTIGFHPMAFEDLNKAAQVPLPEEPKEPMEKPVDPDTVIAALRAVEGR